MGDWVKIRYQDEIVLNHANSRAGDGDVIEEVVVVVLVVVEIV